MDAFILPLNKILQSFLSSGGIGRRQSNHSATYETKSPMRSHRGESSAHRDSTGAQQDTERSTSSIEQLHPLQPWKQKWIEQIEGTKLVNAKSSSRQYDINLVD